MQKVWRVPWTSHCNLLPHLGGVMNPELWFSKRCIRYIKMAHNSENIIVRTIVKAGLNGTHFIMCGNCSHFNSKYRMEQCNVKKCWDEMYKNENESVRICEQIR